MLDGEVLGPPRVGGQEVGVGASACVGRVLDLVRVFGVDDRSDIYKGYGRQLAEAGFAIVAPMNVSLIVTKEKGEKRPRFGESLLDAKFDIQTYVAHGGVPMAGTESGKPATQGNP